MQTASVALTALSLLVYAIPIVLIGLIILKQPARRWGGPLMFAVAGLFLWLISQIDGELVTALIYWLAMPQKS